MINPQWYTNSRVGGFAILEFFIPDDPVRKFVPLRTTHLAGSIQGPFADFTLTHTFRFTSDQYPHTIEARYRFPLPGDAAVTGVTVTFGTTVIEATLKAREQAEKEYEDAKKEGKSAALLTREIQGVFTLQVAGIAPDEDVVVCTRYLQIGEPDGIGFIFRVPLTTAPRYVRGDERGSRSAQAQPLAVMRDPGHRFSMEVSSYGEGLLTSTTHSLTHEAQVWRFTSGDILPDRDCTLVWNPIQDRDHPSLQVFSDVPSHPHFLALVTPPQQPRRSYPRELTILVDHSGSMDGKKWNVANRAARNLLKSLTHEESFNLCLFESTSHWFSDTPVRATQANTARALTFLEHRASGGTELGVALEQALCQLRKEGTISRHIILITDTQVTDEGRILQLVKKERTQENPRRCSILCIDAAPNAPLASLISRYGRGIVRFLTTSSDDEDIDKAFDHLISLWESPVAIDLSLRINRDQVVVPERLVTKDISGDSCVDLGDLIPGHSIWIFGRCGDGPSDCIFSITSPAGTFQVKPDGKNPAIRSLYGAHVVSLLDLLMYSPFSDEETSRELRILGYENDPHAPAGVPLYHENAVKEGCDRIRDLLVRASLDYGIASSETAFIAVRHNANRVVEESVIVANALPLGWSGDFLSGYNIKSHARSIIQQPDGTLGMPKRRKTRDMASGGALLECFGGGCIGGDISSEPRSVQFAIKKMQKGKGDAYILPTDIKCEPSLVKIILYKGRPVFIRGESILFESDAKGMKNKIPREFHIKTIIFSSTESRPEFVHLRLMLFIGDMIKHVFEIPLSTLEAQGGEQPVLATRKHGAVVRLLLMDVSGKPAPSLPEMTILVEGEVN